MIVNFTFIYAVLVGVNPWDRKKLTPPYSEVSVQFSRIKAQSVICDDWALTAAAVMWKLARALGKCCSVAGSRLRNDHQPPTEAVNKFTASPEA